VNALSSTIAELTATGMFADSPFANHESCDRARASQITEAVRQRKPCPRHKLSVSCIVKVETPVAATSAAFLVHGSARRHAGDEGSHLPRRDTAEAKSPSSWKKLTAQAAQSAYAIDVEAATEALTELEVLAVLRFTRVIS